MFKSIRIDVKGNISMKEDAPWASGPQGGWVDFHAAWSGASFGNSATAVATFKLNILLLDAPGDYVDGVGNWLTGIDLTVSGAREGNGRFTTSDFDGALFQYSSSLDFGRQLLEQSGFQDFNLFGRLGCPEGSRENELTLPGQPGERIVLFSLSVARREGVTVSVF